MSETFTRLAAQITALTGSVYVTAGAALIVLLWLAGGLVFGFTDTYQLVINTTTTIITFLMVFIIQTTQNRDTTEIKALLHQLVEDLPDVDEHRAAQRIEDEQ